LIESAAEPIVSIRPLVSDVFGRELTVRTIELEAGV
jgi:hypothetical protein